MSIKMKIKVLSALLAVMLQAGIFAGCGGNNTQAGSPSVLREAGTRLGIKYARNFNIDYLDGGVKLVTDSNGDKLLLVPKGTNVPSGHGDAALVETPIKKAVYISTTHVGLLGALEDDSLYDSVAGVCTPEEQWTTPQVLERFRNGTTNYLQCSQASAGNIEEIVKIRPDFVFTDGGKDAFSVRLRNLLDEVNIRYAALLDWAENGNAESLEWIKFFAAFFNLDEEADRIFETRLARLNELYEKVSNVSHKPTVAYGHIVNGVFYTHGRNSTLVHHIEMAGGSYVFKEFDDSLNVRITREEFLNKCRNVDIIIYGSQPQYCPDKAFLLETEPLMTEFSAFNNDKIYTFEQGYYMNSAKVVEKFTDMVSIIHPELFPGHKLSLYRKLTK